MCYLFGGIADRNALLKQAFRAYKPGGYVESFETSCVFKSDNGTLLEGSPMDQWGRCLLRRARSLGDRLMLWLMGGWIRRSRRLRLRL